MGGSTWHVAVQKLKTSIAVETGRKQQKTFIVCRYITNVSSFTTHYNGSVGYEKTSSNMVSTILDRLSMRNERFIITIYKPARRRVRSSNYPENG